MPVPNRKSGESENDFISRCVRAIIDEYPQEQSLAICYSKLSKEEMSRKKKEQEQIFVLKPNKNENRGDYVSRCATHRKMKDAYPDKKERYSCCLSSYNEYYKYWSKMEDKFASESTDTIMESCMTEAKTKGMDYQSAYQYCKKQQEDLDNVIAEPVAMESVGTFNPEEFKSNLEACVEKRVKSTGVSKAQARKECAASIVVKPGTIVQGSPSAKMAHIKKLLKN